MSLYKHYMKSVVMRREEMLGEQIFVVKLLALLLLISHCGASVSANRHNCIHDTEEIQKKIYGPIDTVTGVLEAFTDEGMEKRTAPQEYQTVPPSDASTVGNIRIVVSTIDFDDPKKYCDPDRQGPSNPTDSQTQGKSVCGSQRYPFTAKKKDILLNKVLPAAIGILSNALSVRKVVGNLKIPIGCNGYTTPDKHKTDGVPNADYVLYVSATPESTMSSTWAGVCMFDQAHRPVSGSLNFGPESLVWKENDANAQRELVRTVVHEILHAIGFSYPLWTKYFPDGNPVKEEVRRGKTVQYFSSKKVAEKAKEYFNCQTLKGPEIEDEGAIKEIKDGERIVPFRSHWKRRSHLDDIMAAISNYESYLSPITLAVLEDSGHYTVDWTKAETPKWMYKDGCGVINDKCNTESGGMGKYFCDEGPHTHACTFDHRSVGQCDIGNTVTDAIPSWAQYFTGQPLKIGYGPFMDYCPIVTPIYFLRCDSPINTVYANDTNIPMYFGSDGRCFNTKGVIKTGYTRPQKDQRLDIDPKEDHLLSANCLQTRCVSNTVEIKMALSENWIPCPSKGAQVTLSKYGYDGYVTCPDPNVVCDGVEINTPPPTETTATTTKTKLTTPTKPTPTAETIPIPTNATTTSTIAKSVTTLSSTMPAVLISSMMFLYLFRC